MHAYIPTQSFFKSLLKVVRAKLAKVNRRQRKMYSGMFTKLIESSDGKKGLYADKPDIKIGYWTKIRINARSVCVYVWKWVRGLCAAKKGKQNGNKKRKKKSNRERQRMDDKKVD